MLSAKRYLIMFVLFASTAPGRAEEPSLRTFYTGHSFHMFVPMRVARMATLAGIAEYKTVGTQSIGGSRVDQHWDKADAENAAKKILSVGGADVFTMAPHLKLPDRGIDSFVELGLKHNPKLRVLVQESWFPFDYYEKKVKANDQRNETDLKQLKADQEKWRTLMETQAIAINKKAGRTVVHIVPAGDAVVKLRELVAQGKAPGIAKQSELFTDPIGHGKAPVALLTSYCNYICITGKSPVGLKVTEMGITPELNALLQQIAWDTVTAYPMSGVKASK